MSRTRYTTEIVAAATTHGLLPAVVEAQVLVESGGHPFAWNPEPRYRYFWDVRRDRPFRAVTSVEVLSKVPPADFPCLAGDPDQEWWAQQASWGLLQILGAVAREHGLLAPYLPQLCDVVTNLDVACAHLAGLVTWAGGDVDQALAAYNGGKAGNSQRPFRTQAYVDRVRARIVENRG